MLKWPVMKYKQCVQLGQLFFPLRQIRYYPPRFILRNPVVEGVSQALQKGYEVALIVYKIKNMSNLNQRFGYDEVKQITGRLRTTFKEIVQQNINEDQIILLDYHFSEGFTIYINFNEDYEGNSVYDINQLMTRICQKLHELSINGFNFEFDKGYMFIQKKVDSVSESIYNARHQALVMAEKKVQSDYNDMLYLMSKVISNKNIRLYGQPIIHMETKQIQAWELLTRGPEGTNLEMPLRLFSVAQQTGHLYDLEMIVVEKTFEKITETNCQHVIFMNCTPLTLGNKRFVPDLKKVLQHFPKIDPTKIIIEMTEQETVEDLKRLNENLRELRALGFRIALDDTGAGYSSLHSIGEILPEIIKIDRAVIENIHENPVSESMLMGIMLIADKVGSLVVAEGIEKIQEVNVLSQHKVDFVQGYYYARPQLFNQQLLSSI
jgi:EAL domain-containing protein (putative c-di-GMP-specific phosphodiesterase class I)